MQKKGAKFNFLNKATRTIVGILLVVLSAIALLWYGNANSMQAMPAMLAQVYFAGEYRIGDGEWQEIVQGKHISSTQGDVALRGNFHMLTPDGEYVGIYSDDIPIAFYTDHINLTFYEADGEPYVIDHENPLFGKSACGVTWTAHAFTNGEELIEIVVHNPHKFGNENAIDDMLSNVALWAGIDFEKGVLDSGVSQRNTGLLFTIVALMFLGIALFSSLIHLKNNRVFWLFGLVTLFAGGYFTYSSTGISFWSESIVFNTTILGCCMMFYMFFLSVFIAYALKRMKKIACIACVVLGALNTLFFIISMTEGISFYDTWPYWVVLQNIVNVCLLGCLIKEIIRANNNKEKWIYSDAALLLLAFAVDSMATWLGIWQGGVASQIVFVMFFIVSMVVVLRIIPHSINAIAKSKELETEKILLNTQLAESRISTMMSQIRPHFIYNALGSIEQLCEIDPPKAGELVHNFAKYLRGNFGELDNPKPILMSQEMEHVHHYINIENVRFPDMTFAFEMNSNDFHIPALTIQPIVENAIKHGLMKLSEGGTIKVISYETEDDYCVVVEDNGVGFDTSVLLDERKHVGIRNIRGRLKAMVNGTLEIESVVGKGTRVFIMIPKGGNK